LRLFQAPPLEAGLVPAERDHRAVPLHDDILGDIAEPFEEELGKLFATIERKQALG
jgi:hypothetical protein